MFVVVTKGTRVQKHRRQQFPQQIKSIQGSFTVGKTITSLSILPNFCFYGMSLRSERDMRPWEKRGYAPVISGVANSNAKITISQNGYVLSSQVVPAGKLIN